MDKELEQMIQEVNDYFKSEMYLEIKKSYDYYNNKHDILKKERYAIGPNNTKQVIKNIPNNKIIDNKYANLVDQKKNYLLSRPISINCEDATYLNMISSFFDSKFNRMLKQIGKDSILSRMGFVYVYVNKTGQLKLKRFDPIEIYPVFKDKSHEELDYFYRKYEDSNDLEIIEKYELDAMTRYILNKNEVIESEKIPYFYINNNPMNWGRIPLICFRANEEEMPLLNRVKSLQDATNEILSKFLDDAQEDSRNTIIVIKNLGGENVEALRSKINKAGVISTSGDAEVSTLSIKIDVENYKTVLEILRKAIIDNGRGIDTKAETFKNAPNQMTIQSMYSEIELDSNDMEMEFKTAIFEIIDLYNYFYNVKNNKPIEILFDKDILINETSAIENAKSSIGIISNETIIKNHPWTTDASLEIQKLKEEKNQDVSEYYE